MYIPIKDDNDSDSDGFYLVTMTPLMIGKVRRLLHVLNYIKSC